MSLEQAYGKVFTVTTIYILRKKVRSSYESYLINMPEGVLGLKNLNYSSTRNSNSLFDWAKKQREETAEKE